MRDAFGGLMNMVIIVVFLVLVSGYLAFNVNYTKAFRVKNKIITTIEQYEGACDPVNENNRCNQVIKDYMKSVGYNASSLNLTDAGYVCNNSYCIKRMEAETDTENVDLKKKVYYKVTTAVVIDIPIINKIMPQLQIFQVSGTTKAFVPSSSK
jgi:hypothetical protein